MRACPLYLAVAYLLFFALPTQAADLAKIERVIAKEPKYQGNPKYCLLVFGPEAKFRVWLVLDGAVLYVDRNGNGDLTAPDKRVPAHYNRDGRDLGFKPGQLGTPDGKTKYDLRQLRRDEDGCDMSIRLEGGRWTRAGFDGPGRLRFADRAQDAPIIHFLGPLTLQRFEPQPGSVSPHIKPEPLVRGQSNNLGFSLGTPGLGSGTFAKYEPEEALSASAEIRFAVGMTITVLLQPDG
jgi:hypothetical protein